MGKQLKPRMEAFWLYYWAAPDGKPNATRAAKLAGYSEKTAYSQGQRLLKNVEIKRRIKEAQSKMIQEAELSQEFVIDGLRKTLTMALEDKQLNPANRSLELLGRHIGMFKEKVEVDTTDRLSSLLEAIQDRPRPGPVLEHQPLPTLPIDSPTVLDATSGKPIKSGDD